MRKCLIISYLTLFSAGLIAADNRISQSARERHHEMESHFSKEKEHTSWWDSRYMTGDWGGGRRALAKVGITVDAAYVADMQANVAGGGARGFGYAGSFGISTNIDFTKAGAKGLELFAAAVWRTGTSLTSRKIDNQFPVAQVFGSETVKFNELYLIQTVGEKRFVAKAGRLNGGNDFLASPLYWHFESNAFDGNPIGIFFNVPFVAYPNPTWGAFIEIRPWKELSTKWAVYNANTEIQKNKHHGLDFTLSSTNGSLWMTEWALLVNQKKTSHGMPGNYKAGAFYLTGEEDKFSGGTQKGDPGWYILLDQMIYRTGDPKLKRGLTPFISLLFQPKNRNLFPFFANAGLVFQGPFVSRPKDSAAFGVAHGSYSSDLRRKQRRTREKRQESETVLELNYWFQLNHWFFIQPDIQYIITPKGLSSTPNAWVIGFQIGLDQW